MTGEHGPNCHRCGDRLQIVGRSASLHLVYMQCHACDQVTVVERADRDVILQLANAIQTAVLIVAQLQAGSVREVDHITELHRALRRAVATLRHLTMDRPPSSVG